MHGLVNRFVEEFLRARYGEGVWREVAVACGVDAQGFHSWRAQPDAVTARLIARAARRVAVRPSDLAEDAGAWLAQVEAIRRLLRFGGRDYGEFLQSLDQLPGRAEMVVRGLGLPPLRVSETSGDAFRITLPGGHRLWICAMAGILRQMADDYGALALITTGPGHRIVVEVPERRFASGRSFALVAGGSGLAGEVAA